MEIYVTNNTPKKLHQQAMELQQIAKEMRRQEFQKLRDEGWTNARIARKYRISRERVRQILGPDKKED